MSLKIDIFAEVHKGIFVKVALCCSIVYSYSTEKKKKIFAFLSQRRRLTYVNSR